MTEFNFSPDLEDDEPGFILPNSEDFIPHPFNAVCPICSGQMVHTEIRVPDGSAYHCWLCLCESQPDHALESMRQIIADGDPSAALVIEED